MPNLCDNRLTIWSDDPQTLTKVSNAAAATPVVSQLQKLASRFGFASVAQSKTGFFDFLRPMPANVEELDIEVPPGSQQPKEYFWQVENWGCRYDLILDFEPISPSGLRASFTTHYSPPVAALQHGASKHGFRFRLEYCEIGGGFCGVATESQNQEYEITLDRPPEEEGIPQELISAFKIDEAYLEEAEDDTE